MMTHHSARSLGCGASFFMLVLVMSGARLGQVAEAMKQTTQKKQAQASAGGLTAMQIPDDLYRTSLAQWKGPFCARRGECKSKKCARNVPYYPLLEQVLVFGPREPVTAIPANYLDEWTRGPTVDTRWTAGSQLGQCLHLTGNSQACHVSPLRIGEVRTSSPWVFRLVDKTDPGPLTVNEPCWHESQCSGALACPGLTGKMKCYNLKSPPKRKDDDEFFGHTATYEDPPSVNAAAEIDYRWADSSGTETAQACESQCLVSSGPCTRGEQCKTGWCITEDGSATCENPGTCATREQLNKRLGMSLANAYYVWRLAVPDESKIYYYGTWEYVG